MTTIVSTLQTDEDITLVPGLTESRDAAVRDACVLGLLRPQRELPLLTLELRFLASFLPQGPIADVALYPLFEGGIALVRWLRLMSSAGRTKFDETITAPFEDGSASYAFALTAGLLPTPEGSPWTTQRIIAMVTDAYSQRGATSTQRASGMFLLEYTGRLFDLAKAPVAPKPVDGGVQKLWGRWIVPSGRERAARLAVAAFASGLLQRMADIIHDPQWSEPAEMPTRTGAAAFDHHATTIRLTVGTALDTAISRLAALGRGFLQVVETRWAVQGLAPLYQEELERQKAYLAPALGTGAGLGTFPGILDADLLAPWLLASNGDPAIALPLQILDPAKVMGGDGATAFAAEVIRTPAPSAAVLASLLADAAFITHVVRDMMTMRGRLLDQSDQASSEEAPPGFKGLDLPEPATRRATFFGIPEMLNGYPIGPWQPGVDLVHVDSYALPTIQGIGPHVPTTAAALEEAFRPYKRLPILIRGEEPQRPRPFVTMRPVFAFPFTRGPVLPMTIEGLCDGWRTGTLELTSRVTAMAGPPDSIAMRLLAEALRFIGVVVVRNGDATGPGIPVLPIGGTWYHCPDPGQLIDPDAEPIGLTMGSSSYYVGLVPFKNLPSSVRMEDLTLREPALKAGEAAPILRNVALRPADDERPNRSLFIWMTPPGAQTTGAIQPDLPIIGWSPEPNLFDIITLLRSPPDAGALAGAVTRFTLSPVPWAEAPLGHRYNAVVRPDAAEAPLVQFAEVPPAWEDLL